MILKAFWQQKFDIKRLYKGSNVSDRGYNVFVNVAIDLRIIFSRQMFMRFSKKKMGPFKTESMGSIAIRRSGILLLKNNRI